MNLPHFLKNSEINIFIQLQKGLTFGRRDAAFVISVKYTSFFKTINQRTFNGKF